MRDPQILAARARVTASKARLDAAVATAKAKLNPRAIAADAVGSATEKASQAAHSGLEVARTRPALVVGLVGAIGLVLARKPVIGWVGGLFGRRDATADGETS